MPTASTMNPKPDAASAASYSVVDALYDLVVDNLEALSTALKNRDLTLKPTKADRLIREINKCLGVEVEDEG